MIDEVKDTIQVLAALLFFIGIIWIVVAHVYLLLTDPEYSKHTDSFWADLQLLKVAWQGCCMVITGGICFIAFDRREKSE